MKLDKPTLEKLCIDAGHVINRNNGQCDLVEDFACRVSTLCIELLKREGSGPDRPEPLPPMTAAAQQCVTIFENAMSIVGPRMSTVEPLAADTLNAALARMRRYVEELKRTAS